MLYAPGLPLEVESYLSLKAENTARSYRCGLSSLADFLAEDPADLEFYQRVSAAHVVAYIASLKKEGLSSATIKQRFNAISSVFQYLSDLEVIRKNPFKAAKHGLSFRDQTQVRPHKAIDYQLIPKLIAKAKKGVTAKYGPLRVTGERDACMIALFYYCGLRRSELISISLGHIHKEGKLHYIQLPKTKSGKEQKQPIPPEAWKQIQPWIRTLPNDDSQAIYPKISRSKISREAASVSTLARNYKLIHLKCGVESSCHDARATACSLLLDQGNDSRDVQKFMRHSTLSMVEVYDKRRKDLADNLGAGITYSKK